MSVEDAAANYIRAEYQFRFGKYAFSAQAQDWLCDAYGDLCEAVTGEREGKAAGRALGAGGEEDDQTRTERRKKRTKKRAKKRTKKKAAKRGLKKR